MLETDEDYEQYNITVSEDAFVVQSTSVITIMQDAADEIKDAYAKNEFKHWKESLTRMQGFTFEVPASLDIILDKLQPETLKLTHLQSYALKD